MGYLHDKMPLSQNFLLLVYHKRRKCGILYLPILQNKGECFLCPPLITAPKTAISPKTVLMPGDPLRAKFIAETFLEDPRLVTDVRGM